LLSDPTGILNMSTMTSKLGLGALFVVAALGAAATGGYFALRHNADDLPGQPAVDATPVAPAVPAVDTPTIEAPVAEPAKTVATPVAPKPAAAPGRPPEPRTDVAPEPATPVTTPPTTTAATPPVEPPAVPVVATPPPAAEPQAPAPAPPVRYDQVTIAADAVLGLRLDSTLSSETAQVEDKVNARLSRDVMVEGRVALATGTKLEGAVTSVERGGKFKDRPRIGFTFHTLVLADNTRVAIHTETIYREGDSPTGQANAKIGGSGVVGAILGGLIGGKKGAIVGSAVGAAGGAAAVASGDRKDVVVTSGTPLTVRLVQPVSILIEREL
jgi:outer membrane biosynthesis protein TonB